MCAGVRAVVAEGATVGLRVTVQKANYRELPRFVRLARDLGVHQVSFLAVDVSNPHAFGRDRAFADDLALDAKDLQEMEALIAHMEREFAAEFARGFIAESPRKLRGLHAYFGALLGQGAFPPVRCNAPEFSAVIGVHGQISPCFFIPGPAGELAGADPAAALDSASMQALRADIRAGRRGECARCVCSMWRDPSAIDGLSLRSREASA